MSKGGRSHFHDMNPQIDGIGKGEKRGVQPKGKKDAGHTFKSENWGEVNTDKQPAPLMSMNKKGIK